MRTRKSLFLLTLAICFLLGGCSQKVSDDDSRSAMQDLYERSVTAREYADDEFENLLLHFDSKCEILETSYGFYTSESPIYVVGYKYSNGINDDLTYAYKISVDNNNTCTIMEEGEETASFLFED